MVFPMQRPQPVTIERLSCLENEAVKTLAFFVRPGSRSRPWIWFEPDKVPPFEGKSAEFQIIRQDKRWRVLPPA